VVRAVQGSQGLNVLTGCTTESHLQQTIHDYYIWQKLTHQAHLGFVIKRRDDVYKSIYQEQGIWDKLGCKIPELNEVLKTRECACLNRSII
jgi:hypothetical protein